MNECEYQEVANQDVYKKEKFISFLKQLLISSTVWMHLFITGLSVGTTTVMVPQLKSLNATLIGDELTSWLYSTTNFASLPWVIILPWLTQLKGIKLLQFLNSGVSIISFIIMYYSTNVYHILLSQVLQGYFHAANITLMSVILTDYSSVKHRGMFLCIKTGCFFWGMLIANVIGTFYDWKNIALVGTVCSLYTLNVIFWPESPIWLASKGKFVKYKKSYIWLYGSNEESDKALSVTISSEPQIKEKSIGIFEIIKLHEFYEPLILSIVSVAQYHFTAKMICSLFVLDIFKRITTDDSSAYMGMLIMDGVTVVSSYVGSYLVRILKLRPLYIFTSIIGVSLLFIMSLYFYLISCELVKENNYVLIAMFSVHSIAISCGPMILSLAVFGELIGSRFRATSYSITATTFCIINIVMVKFCHKMFAVFDVSGTFFFCGVMCGLCTLYLYMFLPETKNKTLKEIEEYFKRRDTVKI